MPHLPYSPRFDAQVSLPQLNALGLTYGLSNDSDELSTIEEFLAKLKNTTFNDVADLFLKLQTLHIKQLGQHNIKAKTVDDDKRLKCRSEVISFVNAWLEKLNAHPDFRNYIPIFNTVNQSVVLDIHASPLIDKALSYIATGTKLNLLIRIRQTAEGLFQKEIELIKENNNSSRTQSTIKTIKEALKQNLFIQTLTNWPVFFRQSKKTELLDMLRDELYGKSWRYEEPAHYRQNNYYAT
jgi:hypothetical protein